jgi:hypothetical protein
VDWYDLIVRKDDKDEAIFILVTGLAPRYTVRGWAYAKECKREEFWTTHGKRPPAYFFPQSALRSMESLPL